MSDKVFVGRRCATVSKPPVLEPISKIVLWVDSENCYEAGDNSGREFEITCPYGSQKMANDLLSKLGGYSYHPLEATDALIDPAAELGDAVTVAGRQTILASMSLNFDSLLTADISAPGAAELKPEYTFTGAEKLLNRKIARTNSRISKTSEEIRLEVFGEGGYTGASVHTLISAAIGNIRLEVSGENGTTSFKLTDGTAEISSQTLDLKVKAVNVTGTLTASQIDASELKVDAANITGTLVIGQQLPSNLATTSDIPTDEQITTITNNAISTAEISASQITAGTFTGGNLTLSGLMRVDGLLWNGYYYVPTIGGYIGATTGNDDGVVTAGACLTDQNMNNFFIATTSGVRMSWRATNEIYCVANGCYSTSEMKTPSDERVKNSISYDLSREERMFASLKPCSFAYNRDKSSKKHWGFVAQEMVASAEEAGLDVESLDAVSKDDKDIYAIAYGEMVALNTHMIQKLMTRVDELERRQTA